VTTVNYDMLDDSQSRPFLSAAELRSVTIPTTKKGGYDVDIANEVLRRAAVTLEGYSAQIDTLQEEVLTHVRQVAPPAPPVSEAETATRLLEAATTTADNIVSGAKAEAANLLDQAHQTLAGVERETAQKRSLATSELAGFYADVAERRAQYQVTLDQFASDARSRQATITAAISALRDATQDILTAATTKVIDLPSAPPASTPVDQPVGQSTGQPAGQSEAATNDDISQDAPPVHLEQQSPAEELVAPRRDAPPFQGPLQ
jgi:hypothetical protein